MRDISDILRSMRFGHEEQYIRRMENEIRERKETAEKEAHEMMVRKLSRNRCPKCGQTIENLRFKETDVDKCSGCGGIWVDGSQLIKLLRLRRVLELTQ
jgi:ribosomal protein L37AE/L43A